VLYSGCLFFGALGFLVSTAPPEQALLIGLGGLALLGILFAGMMYVRRKYQLAK
jgi:hypothetical protein